jgi:plasmid replication initiation protein
MIAQQTLQSGRPRTRGVSRRHRRCVEVWAGFWDDRRAVRLKGILLVACLLAAALLEAPW